MSDDTLREPPTGTKRHYCRVDPDMTDEEIDAWAEQFVDAVLGNAQERKGDSG